MHSAERIGRYRLERRLGSGAFGTVWLARDEELDAPVAVKVLADNWAQRMDVRERFLSEARMLRRAGSDRLVQVHDIGELPDGRPFFVMEYADGGTLEDLLAAGPLPVARALRLTALAARGAAALHEAGIVHRDIKPSNVLLSGGPDGSVRVLLADLGLAKSLAQASGLTQAAGSDGYRPPEQAVAGAGVDERADVYSLGAVGHRLLTGEVPGPPGRAVRPERLRPGLAPGVRRALRRALQPDRERRWPSAAEFAAELERLAGPGGGRRPRHRTALLAGAAVLVAAVAAVGVTAVLADRGGGPSRVRVTDGTGRITAEVPAAWAGQLRDAGWDPAALGLPAGHEPGLVVADDLAGWPDLDTGVNGVFVGLAGHEGLAARVAAVTHPDCRYAGSRTWTGSHGQGRLRTWTGCPGDGGTVTEAALGPAGSTGREQVYVQIRQSGPDSGRAETERVLEAVQVDE
jgi:eukaryotic-like serine/threonine-protein kinase